MDIPQNTTFLDALGAKTVCPVIIYVNLLDDPFVLCGFPIILALATGEYFSFQISNL